MNFVTHFDSFYLPQFLALLSSLKETQKSGYTVWAVCLDDRSFYILCSLDIKNLKLLRLRDFESTTLKELRQQRSWAEYCWTLTPFVPDMVFNSEEGRDVDRLIYVDSDMFFLNDVGAVFECNSLAESAVVITPHFYRKFYDQEKRSGKYCVQFIAFKKNESEPVRRDWQRRCVEWCFDRVEKNKFGDQFYLNFWEKNFPNLVGILSKPNLIIGPWCHPQNLCEHTVAYHFHGVRHVGGLKYFRGNYILAGKEHSNLYSEYIQRLAHYTNVLNARDAISYRKLFKLNVVKILWNIKLATRVLFK